MKELITENQPISFIIGLVLIGLIVFLIVRIERKISLNIAVKKAQKQVRKEYNERKQIQNRYAEKYPKRVSFSAPNTAHEIYSIGNPYRSIGIFGGAGSGKSVSLFLPIISQAYYSNHAILMYDYKNPELTNYLKTLDQHRHGIDVIDFKNYTQSKKTNPIHPSYIKTVSHAKEYANTIYYNLNPKALKSGGDPFWDNSAMAILTATIWYLANEEPHRCTIPEVRDLILGDSAVLLDLLQSNKDCSQLTATIITASKSGTGNTFTGIMGTLQTALSALINPAIDYIFSGNDVSLHINNPENPKRVVIGADEELNTTFAPLISLIFSVAIAQMNKADMHPSYIIMDEAPTLYVPKLDQLPAVGRSRKIALIYGAQDISQVQKMYGKEGAEALLSNLGSQFYGRTTNKETQQHVQTLFGKEDRLYTSHSQSEGFNSGASSSEKSSSNSSGQSWNNSTSQSYQQREVLQGRDIGQFTSGKFAVMGADPFPEDKGLTVLELENFEGNYDSFWDRLDDDKVLTL